MKHKHRTEITLETHEITVIRFRQTRKLFCEFCRETVPHIALEHVLSAHCFSETELERLANSGQIHMTLCADGKPFLCSRSLAAFEVKHKE